MPRVLYLKILILFVFMMVTPKLVYGASLYVKPGKWEFSVIFNLEDDKEVTKKTVRCFTRSNYDPFVEFNKKSERMGCDVKNLQFIEGKQVRWNWNCNKSKVTPATYGKGVYISKGSTINGFLVTITNRDGIRKTTDIDIKGKYIGVCTRNDIMVSEAGKERKNSLRN